MRGDLRLMDVRGSRGTLQTACSAAKPWGRGCEAVSAEGQCPATLSALGHPALSPWLGWSH